MADGSPARPRFFLDEEKNKAFMKDLEARRSHVPSDNERQSAAAIKSVVDDDDEDMVSSSFPDTEEPPSYVVDLGPDPSHESATKPSPSIWSKLQEGWLGVEDKLVEFFGLDQSKYQWAVDEVIERQMETAGRKVVTLQIRVILSAIVNIMSFRVVQVKAGDIPTLKPKTEGLQMQEIQEQTMQRDVEAPK